MKKLLFLLIVRAVMLPAMFGTTYEVAKTGSDLNDGISSPFLTIQHCAYLAVAGDTCDVRGNAGNYVEGFYLGAGYTASGTAWNNAITLKAHTGETVNWTGGFTFNATGAPPYEQYWIIDGFHIDGANKTVVALIQGGGYHVRIQNVELSFAQTSCVQAGGVSWEFLNMSVHDCGNGERNTPDHGIYWEGAETVFDGIEAYQNNSYGIQIYHDGGTHTNNNIVRNCRVHNNYYGTHPVSGNAGGIIIGTGDGNLVYNCLIYNNPGAGIQAAYSCGGASINVSCQLLNNTLYHNEYGVSIGTTYNLVIKNNIIISTTDDIPTHTMDTGTTLGNNFMTVAGDPLFTNPSAADFTLQSGSPAIAYGVNLASIFTTDLLGVTRPASAGWTAGAYDMEGVPPPSTPSLGHPRILMRNR